MTSKRKFSLTFILLSIFVLVFSGVSQPVSALNGLFDEQYYSNNNILYYNPEDNSCLTNENLKGGESVDYAKRTILTASELGAVGDNIKFYYQSGNINGIPWQILAAIHLRATHLKKNGPLNKLGPYQISDKEYPVGDYTDEQFQEASDDAGAYLKSLIGDKDLSEPENVKYALYRFSGENDLYEDQARALGFTTPEAENGEGSPYVMNKFDAVRDPTVGTTATNDTWGELVPGESGESDDTLKYPATPMYGTFVTYTMLSSIKCNTGGLVSGGLNLEQAKALMAEYKALNTPGDNPNRQFLSGTISCDTATDNCVAFTIYFMQKYTTLKYASADGGMIGGRIAAANPSAGTGTTPKAYAIFSTRKGRTICDDGLPCGHTGIVLGVDSARGKVIIGEAAWCNDSFTAAREYDIAPWSDGSYTYVYADTFLKDAGGIAQ